LVHSGLLLSIIIISSSLLLSIIISTLLSINFMQLLIS